MGTRSEPTKRPLERAKDKETLVVQLRASIELTRSWQTKESERERNLGRGRNRTRASERASTSAHLLRVFARPLKLGQQQVASLAERLHIFVVA